MDTQSEPFLALLSDLRDWIHASYDSEGAAVDSDLVERGVALIREAATTGLIRSGVIGYLSLGKPEMILDYFGREEPRLKEFYNWDRWPNQWHPQAVEYIRLVQAALKEKKENG